MKNTLYIFIIFLAFTNVNAQSNLIPNGDFESYSLLPYWAGQVNRAIGWNNVNGLYTPMPGSNMGSPDYFYNGGFFPTSWGCPTPYSGNGMIGLGIFDLLSPNIREYISSNLTLPLDTGRKYILSYYIYLYSYGNNSMATSKGSNGIGFHFSNNPLTQYMDGVIQAIPQIEVDTIVHIATYWKRFMSLYIPDSSYNIVTIGNFRPDSLTVYTTSGNYGAYIFIDKIELYPMKLIIKGDSVICYGNHTILTVEADSIVRWADSLNPTNILHTGYTFSVSPNVTTTYVAFGHWDTAYYKVNVASPPIINIGKDTALCPGQSLQLNATTPYVSYLWQDSTGNPTYNVTQQGTYWVKASIDSNCFAIDSINIIYNPNPIVNLGNDTTLCYGETFTLNAYQNNATYKWQDNSTNATYTIVPPYTPYVFWVEVTKNYCSGSDTIQIYTYPLPIIDLGNNTTLCPGQTVLLDATYPNAIYQWQDNSTLPTYNATETGIYFVKVTDTTTSCSTTSQIKLECELEPEIPNVFTPNGDGYNDYFYIKYIEYWNVEIQIFNRWGTIVYQNNTYKNTWDGKDVADGVYFYVIKANSINGVEKSYKGSVTILR